MKGRLRKWMTLLFAVLAFAVVAGASVQAASNMPTDGKLRQYYGTTNTNLKFRRHRIFVTGYGLLEVTGKTKDNAPIAIRLLSRDAKATSDKGHAFVNVNVKQGKNTFYGVMRGPYYIDVAGSGSTASAIRKVPNYYLAAYQKLLSNNGGMTQGKAYPLSVSDKWYTGTMPMNEDWRNPDWYKFYLSSTRTFNIALQCKGKGYAELRLYGPGIGSAGELIYKGSIENLNKAWRLCREGTLGRIYGRLPGTYYLKISRYATNWKRTSFCYWLKWQ